ncbi:hypothetical protein VTL71DRAFT_11334 [Oculimacula yallundae]|uniref:Uncharacterized protein n=1 Tax=Oculimacula yallundae TaxID=86028 RepID=A0ABR4CRH0_9HELO
MNWRGLRKLDLGNAKSNDFCVIFCADLPQLRNLKFRVSCGKKSRDDPEPLMELTFRFLDSIDELEELVVADWSRNLFSGLVSSIVRHESSLRHLEVNPGKDRKEGCPGWAVKPLTQLLNELPRLRNLSRAIDLLKAPEHDLTVRQGLLIWLGGS